MSIMAKGYRECACAQDSIFIFIRQHIIIIIYIVHYIISSDYLNYYQFRIFTTQ